MSESDVSALAAGDHAHATEVLKAVQIRANIVSLTVS
jgi:hypothetical protein